MPYNYYLPFLFLLTALLPSNPCAGQNAPLADPPIPMDSFRLLPFEPPAPEVLAVLKIPFLDGDQFGLADAFGNILLEPQFEEIAWMEWDLPIFWAKKKGKWTFFDLNGRQAWPTTTEQQWAMPVLFERKGFRFDERGNHIELLIPKIKEPVQASFTDPSGKVTKAYRYYFIKPNTKPPYRAWFMPDYSFFIQQNRDQWVPGIFTSGYQYENLKVMDEHGRFGLLDHEGNLLQAPVRNCATIESAEKILILDEQNRIALRDAARGWQTDFLFHQVETTSEKGLFLGEILEQGKPSRLFAIDTAGQVSAIEGMTKMEWLATTPRSTQKPQVYQITRDTAYAILIDLRSGKEIYRIAHGEIGHVGNGFFEVKKDKKYGWLDSTGQWLLPVTFDRLIGIWPDRRIIGIKDNRAGLFDAETGKELLPALYPGLSRFGKTFGRGVGIHIRSGKDQIFATGNLEITGQIGPNAPIKISRYKLPESASAAAHVDFEKAVLPEIFTSVLPITGPQWLHLFRSDGVHVASLETGPASVSQVFFRRTMHYLDEGNVCYAGFVQVNPALPGKPYFVRMSDGKVFKR